MPNIFDIGIGAILLYYFSKTKYICDVFDILNVFAEVKPIF